MAVFSVTMDGAGTLTSKMTILSNLKVDSVRMTSTTTSLIVASYKAIDEGSGELLESLQMHLLSFDFAAQTFAHKKSVALYNPTVPVFFLQWLSSNEIMFSGTFGVPDISGQVGVVYTGVASERTTPMWQDADPALNNFEIQEEIAVLLDNEEHGQNYLYKGIAG